jgi:hypothetical protein
VTHDAPDQAADQCVNPDGVPADLLPAARDAGALVPIGPTRIGRDASGRFAPGNPGGPGAIAHERTKRARALRQALHDAVTAEDMAAVARALVDRAKAGDVAAARELLDRIIGRPLPAEPPEDDDGEGKQVVIRLEFDDAG